MKQYSPRPGIVRTKICGVYVLIPSREAFDACSSIQQLPMLWAATWDGLVNGRTLEETVNFHRILTKKTDEEILRNLETFYDGLAQKGFLIVKEEEKETEPAAPAGPGSDPGRGDKPSDPPAAEASGAPDTEESAP